MGKRVLFCMPDNDSLLQTLAEVCMKALNRLGDTLEDISAVSFYDGLNDLLRKPEYLNTDYVLISEMLCNEQGEQHKLEPSFLKELRDTFINTRFLVVMPSEEKGKLLKFYKQGYYDAIFFENLDEITFANLFKHKRTEKEAVVYYGLEGMSQAEQEPVLEELPIEQTFEEEMSVESDFEEEIPMEEVSEDISEKAMEEIPDISQTESAEEFVKVEQPYMNWISVNGFVTGFTSPDTVEVKLPSIEKFSMETMRELMPGSPVNIIIALGTNEGGEYTK